MISKKGQAAMEFLMTYGWAIIAAVLAIMILLYFGVFSGGNITGNVILMSQPFHTTASQVVMTTSSTNFEIINKGGSNVVISNINIIGTGPSSGINCLNNTAIPLQADQSIVIYTPCTGPLTAGESFYGDVNILYSVNGLSIVQNAGGTIQTTVQQWLKKWAIFIYSPRLRLERFQ